MKNRINKPAAALLVLALMSPVPAFSQAKSGQLSKETREEVQVLADEFKGDADPHARQAALMTLGLLSSSKDRKQFDIYKTDDQERVRLAAGMALILSGDKAASSYLALELTKSADLYKALREVTSTLPDGLEVPLIRELLKKAAPETRRDAYRYLALQSGELYLILEDALGDTDAAVRAQAVEATMFTLRPDSLKLARQLANHRTEESRMIGLRMAAGLKTHPLAASDASAILEAALKDKSPANAEFAARELVIMRNQAGVDALVEMLPKAEPAAKASILALLLDNGARPPLKPVRALLEKTEVAEERALLYELAAATRDAEVFEELKTMFASDKIENRIIAARALGRTHNDGALPILSGGLFEGRIEIRQFSARSLGLLQNPAALPALKRSVTGERDKNVRLEAIAAVGQIKSPEAIQILRFLTTDADEAIRLAIVRSLRSIGLPEGATALEIMFRDRSLDVQWQAFLAALELNPALGLRQATTVLRSPPAGFLADLDMYRMNPATRETLLEQLITHSDPRIRKTVAARALNMGELAMPVVRKVTADKKTPADTRRELVMMLAEQGAATDMSLFETIVRDEKTGDLAVISAWALANSGSPDLEASFRGYLGNKSPIIRAIATYGMTATSLVTPTKVSAPSKPSAKKK